MLEWEQKEDEAIGLNSVNFEAFCDLIISSAKECLDYIRDQCYEVIASVDSNLISSLLKILTAFMSRPYMNLHKIENQEAVIKIHLCFALIWSIGGNLEDKSWSKFSAFLKQLCTKLKIYSYSTENDSVYDYGIDKSTFTFGHWSERVESFKYDKNMNFFEILVPTSDTVKFKYLLKTLLNSDNNVLFSGQTGVGKSVIS